MSNATSLSYFNVFWLAHAIVEMPVALLAFLKPGDIPLAGVTPTTVLIMRLLATMLLTSCIASFLCFGLPDYLPGKRAFALNLLLFHGLVSIIFIQLPDGIVLYELPKLAVDLIPQLGSIKNTAFIAGIHLFVSFLGVLWWQATLGLVRAASMHAKAQ